MAGGCPGGYVNCAHSSSLELDCGRWFQVFQKPLAGISSSICFEYFDICRIHYSDCQRPDYFQECDECTGDSSGRRPFLEVDPLNSFKRRRHFNRVSHGFELELDRPNDKEILIPANSPGFSPGFENAASGYRNHTIQIGIAEELWQR